jgi:hypothetical protein
MARTGHIRNTHRILPGKHSLGKPRRYKDNIRMDFREKV